MGVCQHNVPVRYKQQQTELDHLIINGNGVFIIEVKNFSGELYGTAEDEEWLKDRFSSKGKLYRKHVRNPIGQVRRQEYILSRFLKGKKIRTQLIYLFCQSQRSV